MTQLTSMLVSPRTPSSSLGISSGRTCSTADGAGRRLFVAATAAFALCALSACGGRNDKTTPIVDQALGQIGTPNAKPDGGGTPYEGDQYIVDAHEGGNAKGMRLLSMHWGRLVDVYDFDSATQEEKRVYQDFVIGDTVQTVANKWTLATNPVTGVTRFTIKAKNGTTAVAGVQVKDAFDLLLEEAAAETAEIDFRDVDEIGNFTRIARNGAIVLLFTDLIDDATILPSDSIKVLAGNPPTLPFDARIIPDPNHGGIESGSGTFHSTRIIVDTTVTPFEQLKVTSSVPVNSLGLPGSESTLLANVAIYLPTQIAGGQFNRVRNLAGKALGTGGNEPIASALPSQDIVRAMRTGTADETSNGFMIDNEAPRVLGSQDVIIPSGAGGPVDAVPSTDENFGYEFLVNMSFVFPTCAATTFAGDVVQVSNSLFADVVFPALGPTSIAPVSGVLSGVRIRVPRDIPGGPWEPGDFVGTSVFLHPFRAGNTPGCFLRFSPAPGTPPTQNVPNDAQVSVRFSEAMDPASYGAFDSFTITRNAAVNPVGAMHQFVVGELGFAPDLREYRFIPSLPFSNQGQPNDVVPTDYFFSMVSNSATGGLRDLAGNFLELVPAAATFRVVNSPQVRNGGYVFRFNSPNLDENGDNTPDIRGQLIQDLTNGRLLPRSVSQFSRTIDTNVPLVQLMGIPAVPGVQTPLSNLGSRLHKMWRYGDMGFSISRTDGNFIDLDAEFTYLSPVGAQVTAAHYPEFLMGLAHSRHLPDEWIEPVGGFPDQPESGFPTGVIFANTYLDVNGAKPFVTHPQSLGFTVSNAGVFTSELGTPLLRFPMNEGLAVEDRLTFTWRNTSVLTRGALLTNGQTKAYGVPLRQEYDALGLPDCYGSVWGGGGDKGVPTVGLPLLVEYRCYPTETLALINFGISISAGSSSDPAHRAFSTGGYNVAGAAVTKNPDLEVAPDGGFQGLAGPGLPPLGSVTSGLDNSVYYGQVDFIIKVSRAFTILVDANTQADPNYVKAIVAPSAAEQPQGTSVVLAFRAHDTQLPGNSPMLSALQLDVYGEQIPTNASGLTQPVAASNPPTCNSTGFTPFAFDQPNWSTSINAVDGRRYVQYRLTFINNVESKLTAAISSLAIAYTY